MTPSLSIIVPTIGRPSLAATLASLDPAGIASEDQVLVVADGREAWGRAITSLSGMLTGWCSADNPAVIAGCLSVLRATPLVGLIEGPETHDYGNAQRQAGIGHATGTHVLCLDDDDTLAPGSLHAIRGAILAHPDRPIIVRMREPSGQVLPGPDDRLDPDLDDAGAVIRGRVGTPCLVAPRDSHLAPWGAGYCADQGYIGGTLRNWAADGVDPVILPVVACLVGDAPRGWGPLYVTTLLTEMVQPDAFKTWLRFVAVGGRSGDVIEDDPPTRKAVDVARNKAVKRFLTDPDLAHCGSLMFIDSDMVFAPRALEALRSDPRGWEFDVLFGLYRARESGLQLVLRERPDPKPGEAPFDVMGGWEAGDVVWTDVAPMGFTLIRRRVLEAKAEDWFYSIRGAGTEDIGFSRDASLAGFRLACHTGVGVGHLTTEVLSPV